MSVIKPNFALYSFPCSEFYKRFHTIHLVKKYKGQHGFSLLEFILALSVGSFIMLSVAQTYPLLQRHVNVLYQNYRLEQVMGQVMFAIQKDLRRTGFCNGVCHGQAMTLAHKQGEPGDSCIIVAYDLNRNGQWEAADHVRASEYFGYRLHRGALERARGVANCQEGYWNNLLDPQEIVVTHFRVKRQLSVMTGKSLFLLQLAGHWKKHTAIRRQISIVFSGYNL